MGSISQQWRYVILIFMMSSLIACGAGSESIPELEPQASEAGAPEVAITTVEEPVLLDANSGQEYYVDPGGSDGNDGSQASPWKTIQHAVETVGPGDTILVNSGTFAGARIENSGTAGAWITLATVPDAEVLINRPGHDNRHESNLEFETWEGDETVAYWVVDGLEVADAPNWGIDMRGSEGNHSHHFVIRNNRVHDNGIDSEDTGIFTAFVDDVVIEGNESYNNGEHGIYLSNSGDRFVVRGNVLHHNHNCGLHMNGDLDSGQDGIISDGVIENNAIYENGQGGCSGINMDGVTNAIVRNNLLTENHAGGISIFQENGAVCSRNIQVLNNTIVQAEDGRWAINISSETCINNKLFNNIILTAHEWRGSILIPTPNLSDFESDYNVVMDRFSADDDNSVISLAEWQAQGFDSNSIVASPEEVFAGENDYHLYADSPAVDAGLTLGGVARDIEGTPRPQGAAYDIGAFEYAGDLPEEAQTAFVPVTMAAGQESRITYTFADRLYRLAVREGAEAGSMN